MASRDTIERVNWYDSKQIDETDMDVEQAAWHQTVAKNANIYFGSGVEKNSASRVVLFDSNDLPPFISTLITSEELDGEPIYETDSFGNTVYTQPSDDSSGNQIEVEVSGASLDGSAELKVFIFGLDIDGGFIQESLRFDKNESQVTYNFFTKIVAIMTQDFFGNNNTLVDGVSGCRVAGGRLRLLEAMPMFVVRDVIMAQQASEPNMDYVGFKPGTIFKTLGNVLNDIAAANSLDEDDLNINVTATSTRTLAASTSSGVVIGEKFLATTDNIQKVSMLLSVTEDTTAIAGEEFDWSGDIVVGIGKLQSSTICPTDTLPDAAIDYDPEPSVLIEKSFDQAELEDLGVVLSDSMQVVDFVFSNSVVADPTTSPNIVPGQYYVVTIRRSGDISKGDIVLQEAANTTSSSGEIDTIRMTVFDQNVWTDITNSDMWFKIYTDSARVTAGTSVDDGVIITNPKTQINLSTGSQESFIDGKISFIDTTRDTQNYIIVQKQNKFLTPESHPTTGDLVYSRIKDSTDVTVVDQSSLSVLLDAGNKTIVLGSIKDTNPVNNPTITGTTSYPGLVTESTFTIISPNSDILLNNLVGSILVPDVDEPNLKYRIIASATYTDIYGDINGDGEIDINDVNAAQDLSGYSTTLVGGSVASSVQVAAIESGLVTMDQLIRADVTGNSIIDTSDAQAIQQNILLGTAFTVGSTFTRVVLTVESLTDPLISDPDMIGDNSKFNAAPFTTVNFRIDPVSLWIGSNLVTTDLRRFVPQTFTSISLSDITGTTPTGGSNITLVPGDFLLTGDLLGESGLPYKVDLEVAPIVINLPEGETVGEVDIFNTYINGIMKFSDGTYVQSTALTDNQVSVVTSIKSVFKDLDGYDVETIDGALGTDESIAINYVQSSGILRIRTKNIRLVDTRPELSTKLILTVYLKKSGFNNTETVVLADDLSDVLTSI